ncbi:MAG: hypothetical protein IK127_00605 [Clostridia bacterium]|nr:hypothetical protein [Clostridia bacterium]
MKYAKWLFLLLALIVFVVPALADTMYVHTDGGADLSLRDEITNEVIGSIPDGTALSPDPQKSTDLYAYVTYQGKSGFVLWRYLSYQAPDGAGQTNQGNTGTTNKPEPQAASGDGVTVNGFTISVTGASAILNEDGTAKVTAESQEVAYWVFNGVRYDFSDPVTELTVKDADRDWAIEAVAPNAEAKTLLTEEQIQAARTGETLVAEGIHAEMSHIDAAGNPGGGWRVSFNFTKDYQNQKTRYKEQGGQISLKVRAVIPAGKYVLGWKFGETEFYPNAVIPTFVVRHLNTSLTYEPIFEGDPNYVPPEIPKVTVTCINCTFTGGDYSGATYGEVPVGTMITVKGEGGYGSWEVNGSFLKDSHGWYLESYTITQGIYVNTVIKFYLTIN